jgi:hypothetical protein
MTGREERIEDALVEILAWAEAYPEPVFSEPTKLEMQAVELKIGGRMVTKMHGSWGRHIADGVGRIAREPLATK